MFGYSYINGDHYIFYKHMLELIDEVDVDRRIRRSEEERIHKTHEVYLNSTFREDLIKLMKEKLL